MLPLSVANGARIPSRGFGKTACATRRAAASCWSPCARRRRRGVTDEYSKENLTGESTVVLVVMADDSEAELSLVYFPHLNHH
jgi:hypothetical protein